MNELKHRATRPRGIVVPIVLACVLATASVPVMASSADEESPAPANEASPVGEESPAPEGEESPAPGPGGEAPVSASVSVGVVRVSIDDSIDDADSLRDWVTLRNEEHVAKALMAEEPGYWIAVEIGGVTYDFLYRVVLMRAGDPVGTLVEPARCVCTSGKLLGLISERIAEVLEELKQSAEEPDDGDDHAVGAVEEPSSAEPSEPADSRRLTVVGGMGIGIAVLGVGAVGAGIPLILREDDIREVSSYVEIRSTGRAGIVLSVAGGVALVAGASMLIADLVRGGKERMVVVPLVGPSRAGVVISRKF